MTAHRDYEFLQGITWYAVDADQRIAAFDLGSLPQAALAVARDWERVDAMMRALPEVTDCRVLISRDDITRAQIKGVSQHSKERLADAMMPYRESIVSELPRRGIYQFAGMPSPYGQLPPKYRLVGLPLEPIRLDSLADEWRQIVGSVTAPVRFSEVREVDVRGW